MLASSFFSIVCHSHVEQVEEHVILETTTKVQREDKSNDSIKKEGLTNRISNHHLTLHLTLRRGGLEEHDVWRLGGVA
jgi:hypothetical protein